MARECQIDTTEVPSAKLKIIIALSGFIEWLEDAANFSTGSGNRGGRRIVNLPAPAALSLLDLPGIGVRGIT